MKLDIQRALQLAREVVEADDAAGLCMDDDDDKRYMVDSIVGALEKAFEDGYAQGAHDAGQDAYDKGYNAGQRDPDAGGLGY